MPGTFLDEIKLSSLEAVTRELNGYAAGALSSDATPAPVKEAFFSFQSTLKDLQDISVYAGDHTLSLGFEGFEFDKIFLPKDRLLEMATTDQAVPNVLGSLFNCMFSPLFSESYS